MKNLLKLVYNIVQTKSRKCDQMFCLSSCVIKYYVNKFEVEQWMFFEFWKWERLFNKPSWRKDHLTLLSDDWPKQTFPGGIICPHNPLSRQLILLYFIPHDWYYSHIKLSCHTTMRLPSFCRQAVTNCLTVKLFIINVSVNRRDNNYQTW